MKCPNCKSKQKRSQGMNCRRCGYRFCLDPKKDGMADGKFLAATKIASGNGNHFYTRNQLFTALCQMRRRDWLKWSEVLVFAAIIGLIWLISLYLALVLALLLVGLFTYSYFQPEDKVQADACLRKWRSSGKELKKMIDKPQLHKPPPEWREPDIYDYGVERMIIVQRDELVDLLVLNGFHAETKSLILSESGYPQYLLPVARRCLADNPQLPVLLLHDSTPAGANMSKRMHSWQRLPLTGHPVTDMGISPQDARRIKAIQPTRPSLFGYAVPLDLIPWPRLSLTLSTALVQGLALGALLAQAQQGEAYGYAGYG